MALGSCVEQERDKRDVRDVAGDGLLTCSRE